jgi:hypothetical protein
VRCVVVDLIVPHCSVVECAVIKTFTASAVKVVKRYEILFGHFLQTRDI